MQIAQNKIELFLLKTYSFRYLLVVYRKKAWLWNAGFMFKDMYIIVMNMPEVHTISPPTLLNYSY